MNAIGYIFDGGSGRALSPKASMLARYLMSHPNRIIPRDVLARDCEFEAHGRACDTYISEIRKALGDMDRLVSKQRVGYGWIGDPVVLIACVKECARPPADPMLKLTVMTQAAVAHRLGIPIGEVRRIEKSALKKMSEKPELKDAWNEMRRKLDRIQFDPFHEVWLYSVGDQHETH